MSSNRYFLLVAALGLLAPLSGCAMDAADSVGASTEELLLLRTATTTIARAPLSVAVPRTCNRRRMVGQPTLRRSCPPPSGQWVRRDFMAGVYDEGGLSFCLYEFTGTRYTQSGLPTDRRAGDDVGGRAPADWLEADCNAVVGLGDTDTDSALELMVEDHQASFLEHIAAVDSLPSIPTWSTLEGYPRTTEVAILDSSDSSTPSEVEPKSGEWLHGRAVGLAIRNIACPEGRGGTCPLDITNYEVLSLDSARGGSFGNVTGLATSIVEAVNQARGNLVINLSVGFHPDFAYRSRASDTWVYKAQTASVRAALNYAACHGALVIAAAGNTDDGPAVTTSGLADPMFPAGLGRESGWTCDYRRVNTGHPLVYTVGAVGPGDEDVVNARERGVPALVAPGFAVTFDNTQGNIDGDLRTIPLGTGSSFGAAGTSAVAALVWSYRPALTPAQVMAIVRTTAVDLGRSPDFCDRADPGCDTVKRVSACNAIERAYRDVCQSNSWYRNYSWYFCRDVVRCDTPAAGTPTGPAGTNFRAMLELATPAGRSFDPAVQLSHPCASVPYQGSGDQPSVCPGDQYDNGMRSPGTLFTQPGDDLCGACAVGIGGGTTTVVVGLDPSYTGTVTSPVLNYGGSYYGLGTLSSGMYGSTFSFRLPTVNYSATASLSYNVSGSQSITSVLPVYSY